MKKEFRIAAIVAAITLSGCASDSNSTASLPLETNQTQNENQFQDVTQALDLANNTLEKSHKMELAWFATEQLKDAVDALNDAKEYYAEFEHDPSEANSSAGIFSSKTNIQATQDALAQFNVYIQKANAIRSEALTVLEEAFSYRKQLDSIEAEKYYPTTAKQLEQQLKKLVNYVADDNAENAIKYQPELVRKQRALEVKTVTKIYLSESQKELKRQKTADISRHAPETLRHAEATLKAAEAFINAEPRAVSRIDDKAEEARFALAHSQQVATAVKKLKAMPQSDYERHIVSYEKILLEVSVALGSGDLRDQPISLQGKHLVNHIRTNLQGQNDSLIAQKEAEAELEKTHDHNSALQLKIAELKATSAKERRVLSEENNRYLQQIAELSAQLSQAKSPQAVQPEQISPVKNTAAEQNPVQKTEVSAAETPAENTPAETTAEATS
ncbi:hypothetical protein [Photobacterium lipolyticum]|uniref:Uncharacterized protein n=1 Tax=Photobacterium lipolyticum TaxID=266810 RepID=A0A2T3N526_9GAMM|nr:hypothetical protein [Photobacterium lipolyticum]PSW07514.1 hypothetical protein C9I89_02030 [Photobacterium lipolyticum]